MFGHESPNEIIYGDFSEDENFRGTTDLCRVFISPNTTIRKSNFLDIIT